MGKMVVVYAGGFQPFHRGHLSSYIEAKNKFPNADFYVAASGDVKERPIPYDVKKFLATQAGVKPEDFPDIVVRSPLNPKEILSKYNPEEDVFVLVRSERDPMTYTKKDGTPGYYQPWTDKGNKNSFNKNAYVYVTKRHDFKLNGQDVFSGTQVRDMYKNSDDEGRINIIKQLYPDSQKHKQIKTVLDRYIGNNMVSEKVQQLIKQIKPLLKEASPAQKAKLLALLETAKKRELSTISESKLELQIERRLERLEYDMKAAFDRMDKIEKALGSQIKNLELTTGLAESSDYKQEK